MNFFLVWKNEILHVLLLYILSLQILLIRTTTQLHTMSTAEWLKKKKEQLARINNLASRASGGNYPMSGESSTATATPLSRGRMMVKTSQQNIVKKLVNSSKPVSEKNDSEVEIECAKETVETEPETVEKTTFNELASACGAFVSANFGNNNTREDECSDHSDVEVGKTAEDETNIGKRKKKTPKEYRMEAPKMYNNLKSGLSKKISKNNRKMFKESWNTDKSRLQKRQPKFDRRQNFLVLMEDNIHEQGHDNSAKSAGKVMAFGMGPLKEKFISGNLKFNNSDYIIHKNAHDFTPERFFDSDSDSDSANVGKKQKKQDKECTLAGKYKARKVSCPGAQLSSESEQESD